MIPYGKSLKKASTRSIGSDATSVTSQKALNTSLGRNGPIDSTISKTASLSKLSPVTSGTGSIHRGSLAGLNTSKNVHLNFNNSGYFNKNNQTARYTKKRLPKLDINSNIKQTRKVHRSIDNRPLKSGMGSVSKLLKKIG